MNQLSLVDKAKIGTYRAWMRASGKPPEEIDQAIVVFSKLLEEKHITENDAIKGIEALKPVGKQETWDPRVSGGEQKG